MLAGAAPGSCRLADVKVVHGCAAARLRTLTASQQDWFAQRRQQLIYRFALRSVLRRPFSSVRSRLAFGADKRSSHCGMLSTAACARGGLRVLVPRLQAVGQTSFPPGLLGCAWARQMGTGDARLSLQDWPPSPSLLEQLRVVLERRDTDPEQDPLVQHWPVVTESSCFEAGLGVQVRCQRPCTPCPAGTLMALYPGAVRLHAPAMIDAWGEPEVVNLPPLGVTGMGTRYVFSTHLASGDGAPELTQRTFGGLSTHSMRWACGHRINHPNRANPVVNVQAVPAHVAPLSEEPMVHRDHSETVASTIFVSNETMAWVPTYWAADWWFEAAGDGRRVPRPKYAPIPVMMMVTTTEVWDGEELFYDYKLSRAGARDYPWYFRVS